MNTENRIHESNPEKSLRITDPYFLQQQFSLTKEQWDDQFRALVQEKSEANQIAIQETEQALERGEHEKSPESKEPPEVLRRQTFERYKNGLGLTEDTLRGKRILDLGSGQGEFVDSLIQENITQEVYGLDANLDEPTLKEELKKHLLKGDFSKELPVQNLDYIVSLGAVSNAIWGGEKVQDIESIIKNALAVLTEEGEIRIYPIPEATEGSDLEGIKESRKKWLELLDEISKTEGIAYTLEPRDVRVVGKNNDVILESVLIIKKGRI